MTCTPRCSCDGQGGNTENHREETGASHPDAGRCDSTAAAVLLRRLHAHGLQLGDLRRPSPRAVAQRVPHGTHQAAQPLPLHGGTHGHVALEHAVRHEPVQGDLRPENG